MNILFRVDASIEIGSGHVMRCLTLADALRENGANVSFASRELPGNFCAYVAEMGFDVFRLPLGNQDTYIDSDFSGLSWANDAAHLIALISVSKRKFDWLIVDHYQLEAEWESKLKQVIPKIMVIDDLASRSHVCDLLLDQNFYGDATAYYDSLVPATCKKLLGTKYVLLRSEFQVLTERSRHGDVQRLLIFFGASDTSNETRKVLEAIRLSGHADIAVDVILGVNHPDKQSIHDLEKYFSAMVCHDHVTRMSDLMLKADLYVGAAGTTTWERCRVGLPAIVIAVAENQVRPCEFLHVAGVIDFLGAANDVTVSDISGALMAAINSPGTLLEMTRNAMKLVDGQGVVRCVQELLNFGGVVDEFKV